MTLQSILAYRLDLFAFLFLSLLTMGFAHWICACRGRRQGMPVWSWLFWFVLMLAGAYLSEMAAISEKEEITGLVQGLAPTYAQEMERLGHSRIHFGTSPDDPTYRELINAEIRWLKANSIVADIYTFGKGPDGKAVLLVDSETDYDHNGKYEGLRESRTRIGEEFPLQNRAVKKALAGEIAFEDQPYTDRWGAWVSGYYPIRDAEGRPQAVLGVDYPARQWLIEIFQARTAVFIFNYLFLLMLCGYGVAETLFYAKDRRFRAMIENSQDIITLIDGAGKILYESPSIKRVLGYEPKETCGKTAFSFLHPDDLPALTEKFQNVLENPGKPQQAEFRFKHKDGSWHYFEAVGINLLNDPSIGGMILNSRDVTKRKRAEQELEVQRVRSVQTAKMASLGEMAAGIGHEINTPLSVIVGRVDQLKKLLEQPENNKAQITGCAENLKEMAMRIAQIIRSLRAFSRDASHDAVVRTPLRPIIEDVMAICSERFKSHGIELEVRDIPDLALDCRGAEISQVLLNLLSNAFDAVEKSPQKKVTVAAYDRGQNVEITVEDTGSGIVPEVRRKLFQPFFTTKAVGKGTGLGLSICKGLVEGHGGFIAAEENRKSGALFSVVLPREQKRSEKKAA